MGTSTSSKGGGPRSPFDPAWLTDGAGPDGAPDGDGEDGGGNPDGDPGVGQNGAPLAAPPALPPVPSQSRRFAGARAAMSGFLDGGGGDSLRSATKSMIGRGMGGPQRAARTMRSTSQGAGQLGQFLADARNGNNPQVADWVQRVRDGGLSAKDIVLELVREVLPGSGSVDEDSVRNAAAEALGKLYEVSPDVDIFNLSDQQIADVIGYTVANDICNRIDLQLGQSYEKLKFSPEKVQEQRNDIKEYVQGRVRVEIEKRGPGPLNPTRLAATVLASTLRVFSES